jgi:hypothetical protein
VRRVLLLIIVLVLIPAQASAWGGFTHQELSLMALNRIAKNNPGAKRVLQNENLLRLFLGASMAPDMGLNFWFGLKDADVHELLHNPDFVEKLVEISSSDTEAYAKALGFKAHIIADRWAHGDEGYAELKRTLPLISHKGLNHTATEAVLDIQALARSGPSYRVQVDAARVEMAASLVGVEMPREKILRVYRRFHRSVVPAKALFIAIGKTGKAIPGRVRKFDDVTKDFAGAIDDIVAEMSSDFDLFASKASTVIAPAEAEEDDVEAFVDENFHDRQRLWQMIKKEALASGDGQEKIEKPLLDFFRQALLGD